MKVNFACMHIQNCATTTRNLDIGHEIARKKQLIYDRKDKPKKWFLLWNKHFWPQQMFQ
jgi:hypothetical protein